MPSIFKTGYKLILTVNILSIVFFNNLPVFSQSGLKYISSTSGAACQEVQYFNNYLYAGTGSTLMIFEAAENDPPPFFKLFEYHFRSVITDIKIHDGYLFVAANHDGISKWDIGNPSGPAKLAEYIPDNFTDAAYDMEFAGDTVFVADGDKVMVLRDGTDHFSSLFEFANQTGNAKIKGGAKTGSLFIYTVAYDETKEGVYIYNLNTRSLESFYPVDFGDPEDVLIGNDTIIHVLGGTQATTNLFNPNGYFFALDIADISNPRKIFEDTLLGVFGGAIASALNGQIVNDTVYVATEAAIDPDWIPGDPGVGMVYVYDATDPSNIRYICDIPVGLWNFDLDIDNRRMFIASEWYGIKTIDISDFNTPLDLGNTLTGGWNKSSDKCGNYLVVANEGYGFKKYNISVIRHPELSGTNNDNGFCEHVSFSGDGRYICGMYSTGNGFRVFDFNTLTQVSFIPDHFIINRSLIYNNSFFTRKSVSLTEMQLYRIDVTDALHPALLGLDTLPNINDMAASNKRLYVSTDPSLYVFKITDAGLELLHKENAGLFQSFKALTVLNDTVYNYIVNKGLVRYLLDSTGSVYMLSEDTVITPVFANPEFLAVDNYGLYLGYRKYGIYSLGKKNLKQTGYYRTGLGLNSGFGLQDLFCKDGFVFVVEYHSQTTILTNNDKVTTAGPFGRVNLKMPIVIYPNPAHDRLTIRWENDTLPEEFLIQLYDIKGRLVYSQEISDNPARLYLKNLAPGLYFYQLLNINKNIISEGKLLIE